MPALLLNFEKKTAATKVKKAYSELLQAIELSESHNGELKEWTFPEAASVENTRNFVDQYIKPYFTDLKECSTGIDPKCGYPVSLHGVNYIIPNGTGISIVSKPTSKLYILIDINNKNNPNEMGKDAFYFTTNNNTKTLKPHGWKDDVSVNDILNGYTLNGSFITCTKTGSRHGCTLLLMLKNWEIDSEYPW